MNKNLFLTFIAFISFFVFACNAPKEPTDNVEQIMDTLEVENLPAPEWTKNSTVYEVNIRQYSKEGTFNAITNDLPRLKALGVDILWLMPIHPIGVENRKGTMGSYYAVADYKAVNPEYGTMEDFKNLVTKTHENGMYLIIDWVANHTAFDNVWVKQHPEWYTKDSTGKSPIPPIGTDWTDVADLNFDVPEMRMGLIDAMKFWVDSLDIDGFRCDAVGTQFMPLEFWKQVKTELDKGKKHVYMLGEGGDKELTEAFHSLYGWHIHHVMNSVAQGKKHPLALDSAITEMITNFGEASLLQFTSNHDENSWAGTEFERMGAAAQTFAAFVYTIPGIPLMYNAQEAPLKKRLSFFEKDPITWGKFEYAPFYTKLNSLRETNAALWSGVHGGSYTKLATSNDNAVFAFERTKDANRVICIYNLTKKTATAKLNVEGLDVTCTDYFTDTEAKITNGMDIKLKPWEYKIYIVK